MSAGIDWVIRRAQVPRCARAGAGESAAAVPEGHVDVGVRGDRIVAVGPGLPRAAREIDAAGALLLPGLVDNHVHYREPGASWKEGFVAGTEASLRGGATTVGEVQNNPPLIRTAADWRRKMASIERRARARVMAYGCALRDNVSELCALAAAAPAVKLFLAAGEELEVSDRPTLRAIFAEVAAADGLLLLHAEMGPAVRAGLARLGERAEDFARARSVEAEVEAVELSLELCAQSGARIHFFHVSSAAACERIRAAKARGLPVSAAACAHYLLFTSEDVAARGAVLKCNPSIKPAADRAALRAAVRDGTLDVVQSDHAPHPRAEKLGPFAQAPSGIPGADLFLSLWLELVDEGVLDLETLCERAALAPARLHRLPDRGRIAPGALADLVLVEEAPRAVRADELASKAGLSPYVGRVLRRRAGRVWLGGRLAFDRAAPADVAALEAAAPPPLDADGGAATGCC